jgi:hypothetical protein
MSTTVTKLKIKPQKTSEQHQKEYSSKHVNIVITRKNYDDMRLLGQVPETISKKIFAKYGSVFCVLFLPDSLTMI